MYTDHRRPYKGGHSDVIQMLPGTRLNSVTNLVYRCEFASCSSDEEEIDRATRRAAQIRAHQGNHEAEVSCTSEAGLQQCRRNCKKNPGHLKFIPIDRFNIEHLPARYRDNDIVNMVRATSDITCRLTAKKISGARPKTWPESEIPFPFSADTNENFMMTGTGWVSRVYKYMGKKCECEECTREGTSNPKTVWGEIFIKTACHVVCNDEEAKFAKCYFFYDSPDTNMGTTPTLTGFEVWRADVKGDWCLMKHVTHNIEIVDTLGLMWSRWWSQHDIVYDKYISNKYPGRSTCFPGLDLGEDVKHDLCIVVSHPHGCSKQISIGTWAQRSLISKKEWEDIAYSYNAATCPGSSGAPVFTLVDNDRQAGPYFHLPAHSKGHPGNDNFSGVGWE